ncbi:MAG: glycosyltransferase family 4 protein [Thermodesulfobacteriota bacterium]
MLNVLNTPKVLVISHMYPSSVDELRGLFIHHHLKALRSAGVDFKLLRPLPWSPKMLWSLKEKWRHYGEVPKKEWVEDIEVRKIQYIELPIRSYRPFSGVSIFCGLLPYVLKLRKSFKFNILHAHTITPDGHAAVLLKQVFRVPIVCTVRGSDLNQYPFSSKRMYKITRHILERADAVITVSNDLARKVRQFVHSDGNEIKHPLVIYNGVDSNVFYRYETSYRFRIRAGLGIPPDGEVLCFVGRCEKEKGVFELLHAFMNSCKYFRDTYLIMIGEGKDYPSFRNEIEKSKLIDRVFFVGAISQKSIPDYLNASDIFVLPSYAEGMANAVYEAMACGLPIITTNVGGMPEVISHGKEGLLSRPQDSRDLEACIIELLKDPGRSKEMGQRGRNKVKEEFSWEKNAREHLRVYEEVLRRNEV